AAFVAGHGAGHAESGVAVVIVCAEAELHQFAERVEFFGDQLSGADHAEGAFTVPCLDRADTLYHYRERLIPRNARQPAIGAEQWILGAALGGDRMVLAQALGTEFAAVHRMTLIAARRHGATIFHPDQHAAAHRAVAACGGDPVVGHSRFGHVAEFGVVPV